MDLLAHIVQHNPAELARADASLFASVVGSLEFGIAHFDAGISRRALEAMYALGRAHAASRRPGDSRFGAFDLAPQMACVPDLFSRLARAVLQLALGGERAPDENLAVAAEALAAAVACDPGGYTALVQGLLAPYLAPGADAALAQRLAAEFTSLTEDFFRLVAAEQAQAAQAQAQAQAQGFALAGGGGGSGGRARPRYALDGPSRKDFTLRFERFVPAVRGMTTIL